MPAALGGFTKSYGAAHSSRIVGGQLPRALFLECNDPRVFLGRAFQPLHKPCKMGKSQRKKNPSAGGAAQVSPARKRWESTAKEPPSAVGATLLSEPRTFAGRG